jgi:hypothetical protein
MRKYVYETCCVNLSRSDVDDLQDMTDHGRKVSYKTFRKNCPDIEQWAEDHAYERSARRGLTLQNDYHVAFFKSRFRGRPCYYLVHSSIEYIFCMEEANG